MYYPCGEEKRGEYIVAYHSFTAQILAYVANITTIDMLKKQFANTSCLK